MCFRPVNTNKPQRCPQCGAMNAPTAIKCRKCGFAPEFIDAPSDGATPDAADKIGKADTNAEFTGAFYLSEPTKKPSKKD